MYSRQMLAFGAFSLAILAPAWTATLRFDLKGRQSTLPTGKIAFETGTSEQTQIFVIDANSSSRRLLSHKGPNSHSPSFSKDGKHIVFLSDRGGQRQIYVMDSDGSHVRKVTQ